MDATTLADNGSSAIALHIDRCSNPLSDTVRALAYSTGTTVTDSSNAIKTWLLLAYFSKYTNAVVNNSPAKITATLTNCWQNAAESTVYLWLVSSSDWEHRVCQPGACLARTSSGGHAQEPDGRIEYQSAPLCLLLLNTAADSSCSGICRRKGRGKLTAIKDEAMAGVMCSVWDDGALCKPKEVSLVLFCDISLAMAATRYTLSASTAVLRHLAYTAGVLVTAQI